MTDNPAPPPAFEHRPRWTFLVPLLAALGLAAIFAFALLRGDTRERQAANSAVLALPKLALPGLPGTDGLDLARQRGAPVLVNLFASWCAPCEAEHPMLTLLAQEGRVRLVGIAFKDKPEATAAFLARLGNPFAAVGLDQSGRVGLEFGLQGVPETLLFDGSGRLAWRHAGPLTPAVLAEGLEPRLRQLGVRAP